MLGVFAQILERRRRSAARAAPHGLGGQKLHRAVHADGPDFIHLGQIGIDRLGRIPGLVADKWPVAPDGRLDRRAILGMRAHPSWQRQKPERPVQIDCLHHPSLGQRGALGLGVVGGGLAQLHIGAKPAIAQRDGQRCVGINAQHLALRTDGRAGIGIGIGRAEGAGVAAVGIVRTADEGPARACGAHAQPPLPTGRAGTRIRAVGLGRKQMRLQHLVDLVQHIGDAQFRRFGQGCRKIAPKGIKHRLVGARAGADLIQLVFQIGGEIIFDVSAKVIDQECSDQPPLVFGDQAVLVLAHIAARHDRVENAGIGRRPPDAQLFHPLDQCRLGVAGRGLGDMLLAQNRAIGRQKRRCILGHAGLGGGAARQLDPIARQGARHGCERLATRHLWQAAAVFVFGVVAAFFVKLQEPVEQHHLSGRAQFHL